MVEQSEMNADDHVDCCNTKLASEKKTSSTGGSLQSNDWAQGRTSQFYSLFGLFQRGVQHETSIGRARKDELVFRFKSDHVLHLNDQMLRPNEPAAAPNGRGSRRAPSNRLRDNSAEST
jgi:hypothetical protein